MSVCVINNNQFDTDVNESIVCLVGKNGSFVFFYYGDKKDMKKFKRFCNYCKEISYVKEQCFKLNRYSDWFKGKRVNNKVAVNVLIDMEIFFKEGNNWGVIKGVVDYGFVSTVVQEIMRLMKEK